MEGILRRQGAAATGSAEAVQGRAVQGAAVHRHATACWCMIRGTQGLFGWDLCLLSLYIV